MLMFHPLNHYHVSFSPSLSICPYDAIIIFNPIYYSNETDNRPDAHMGQDEHLVSKMLVMRKSNYNRLRSAVHHIPSVSVLQDKVTTYCDNLV